MAIRRVGIILLAAVSAGLGACATGFKATYDSDPSHDFSGYQTYAWISANPMIVGPTNRVPNPLLEPRIMATVESGLTAKGYNKVDDPEKADFVLSFTVGSREEIQVNSYPTTYAGYGPHEFKTGKGKKINNEIYNMDSWNFPLHRRPENEID